MSVPPGLLGHSRIDDDIRGAIDNGAPLVALESSPFAFGWTRSRSLEVLDATLAAVRRFDAVPAVLWVERGEIRVSGDFDRIGKVAGGEGVGRISRATLASGLLQGEIGATTISATMMIAAATGISTLAVGGIGGVHLGAFGPHPSLDVSPDIDELARTPLIVVSSGPKIILDIPGTLEMLETRGVPLVTMGSEFVPGYFVRHTEHPSPVTVADVDEAASLASRHLALNTGTAMLFCVPIPERAAIPLEVVTPIVTRAQDGIAEDGLRGGKVTRAILRTLAEATEGQTEEALEAVTIENAEVAAQLASRLRIQ